MDRHRGQNINTMLLIFRCRHVFRSALSKEQCRERCLFHALWIPASMPSLCSLSLPASSPRPWEPPSERSRFAPIAAAVARPPAFAALRRAPSWRSMFGDNPLLHLRHDNRRLQRTGLRDERQVPRKLLDRSPGCSCRAGADPCNLLPTGAGHTDRPRIPSAADGSVPARADRRHRGHSGVCRTPYRYCFRCRYHARYGTDDALGYALQHGKRHFGYV